MFSAVYVESLIAILRNRIPLFLLAIIKDMPWSISRFIQGLSGVTIWLVGPQVYLLLTPQNP